MTDADNVPYVVINMFRPLIIRQLTLTTIKFTPTHFMGSEIDTRFRSSIVRFSVKCHDAFRSYSWTRPLFDFGRFSVNAVNRNHYAVWKRTCSRKPVVYCRTVEAFWVSLFVAFDLASLSTDSAMFHSKTAAGNGSQQPFLGLLPQELAPSTKQSGNSF